MLHRSLSGHLRCDGLLQELHCSWTDPLLGPERSDSDRCRTFYVPKGSNVVPFWLWPIFCLWVRTNYPKKTNRNSSFFVVQCSGCSRSPQLRHPALCLLAAGSSRLWTQHGGDSSVWRHGSVSKSGLRKMCSQVSLQPVFACLGRMEACFGMAVFCLAVRTSTFRVSGI